MSEVKLKLSQFEFLYNNLFNLCSYAYLLLWSSPVKIFISLSSIIQFILGSFVHLIFISVSEVIYLPYVHLIFSCSSDTHLLFICSSYIHLFIISDVAKLSQAQAPTLPALTLIQPPTPTPIPFPPMKVYFSALSNQISTVECRYQSQHKQLASE